MCVFNRRQKWKGSKYISTLQEKMRSRVSQKSFAISAGFRPSAAFAWQPAAAKEGKGKQREVLFANGKSWYS